MININRKLDRIGLLCLPETAKINLSELSRNASGRNGRNSYFNPNKINYKVGRMSEKQKINTSTYKSHIGYNKKFNSQSNLQKRITDLIKPEPEISLNKIKRIYIHNRLKSEHQISNKFNDPYGKDRSNLAQVKFGKKTSKLIKLKYEKIIESNCLNDDTVDSQAPKKELSFENVRGEISKECDNSLLNFGNPYLEMISVIEPYSKNTKDKLSRILEAQYWRRRGKNYSLMEVPQFNRAKRITDGNKLGYHKDDNIIFFEKYSTHIIKRNMYPNIKKKYLQYFERTNEIELGSNFLKRMNSDIIERQRKFRKNNE